MRSWSPYLWKELRQSLWLGLAAVGVFAGVPLLFVLIQVTRGNGEWYNNDALGMVLLGGPVLAVVAGVCALGREQGAIERFWRSRPVNLYRWLLIKYLTGLAIVWLACLTPVLIEMWGKLRTETVRRITEDAATLLVYGFILMLIYSESFVLGQCVRKDAPRRDSGNLLHGDDLSHTAGRRAAALAEHRNRAKGGHALSECILFRPLRRNLDGDEHRFIVPRRSPSETQHPG